jgi:hypothetical protein
MIMSHLQEYVDEAKLCPRHAHVCTVAEGSHGHSYACFPVTLKGRIVCFVQWPCIVAVQGFVGVAGQDFI